MWKAALTHFQYQSTVCQTANSSLTTRQRSQTERKVLTRMIDEMESDEDDLIYSDENKKKGIMVK